MISKKDYYQSLAEQIKLVRQLNEVMYKLDAYPQQLTENQINAHNDFQTLASKMYLQIKLLNFLNPELKDY
jgi:hypothetical protein